MGVSMAQILKVGLEKIQVTTEDAYKKGHEAGSEEGRRQGHEDGEQLGWDLAELEYAVRYYCAACHHPHLTITTDEEKQAAADLMYEAGWHDRDCQFPE